MRATGRRRGWFAAWPKAGIDSDRAMSDGAELDVVDARSSESPRASPGKSSRSAAQADAYSAAKSCDE